MSFDPKKIMAIVLPLLAIGVAAGVLTVTDQSELTGLISAVATTVAAAAAAIWALWKWIEAKWFTKPSLPEPQPQPGPQPPPVEPPPLPPVVRTRPGISDRG